MAAKQKKMRESGQAMIEMIMLLPILILLIVWMFNAFKSIRAGIVAQRAVYVNLIGHLDNRPMTTIDGMKADITGALGDGVPGSITPAYFAVQSRPAPNQQTQEDSYSIRIDSANAVGVRTHDEGGEAGSYRVRVGICLFPNRDCAN